MINNTSYTCKISHIKKECEKILSLLVKKYKKNKTDIRVALLTADQLCLLNKEFCGKDAVTDVLTFSDEESDIIGGDVAVCIDRVYENAIADGGDKRYYLAEVILHGMLHLFGIEHDYGHKDLARIYAMQKEIISEAAIDLEVFNV